MEKQVVILIIAILLSLSSCDFFNSFIKEDKCEAPASIGIIDAQSSTSAEDEVALTFDWTPVPAANSYDLLVFSVNGEGIIDDTLLQVDNIDSTSYTTSMNIPVGDAIVSSVSSNCGEKKSNSIYSEQYVNMNGGGTVDIVPYGTMPDFRFAFTSNACHQQTCEYFKFPLKMTHCVGNTTSPVVINPYLSNAYFLKNDICLEIKRLRYTSHCDAIRDIELILNPLKKYIKYDYKECK